MTTDEKLNNLIDLFIEYIQCFPQKIPSEDYFLKELMELRDEDDDTGKNL